VPVTSVRWKRWIVKPFGEEEPANPVEHPQALRTQVERAAVR
jgi:hypothetical protein